MWIKIRPNLKHAQLSFVDVPLREGARLVQPVQRGVEGVQGLLTVGVAVRVEAEHSRRGVGRCPTAVGPALFPDLRVQVFAGQQLGLQQTAKVFRISWIILLEILPI